MVESAEPDGVRGHTMYHRDSAGSISFAEFRHLGKPGKLGKYSLHFHQAGDSMRGASVVGASIWDSGNRWITIHGTNYLVVRDCVGYGSLGHGFFLEDGTEVDNILDGNLAVQAIGDPALPGQVLACDRNEGAGFWWANSRNAFTRNVAVECDGYGFRFEGPPPEGDVRSEPFLRFDDNEAHGQRGYGVNLGGPAAGGPSVQTPSAGPTRSTRSPSVACGSGIATGRSPPRRPASWSTGSTMAYSEYGIYRANFDRQAYRDVTIYPMRQALTPRSTGRRPTRPPFPAPRSRSTTGRRSA